MSDALMILSGMLVSVRRNATLHGGGTRSHFGVWTEERCEVWVRQDDGTEAQVTIRSKLFPARTGHHVTLLIDTGGVLSLINWTTRKRVNYLRTDTIGAFRRIDLAPFTLLAVATAMLWGRDGFPAFAILVMLYTLTVSFLRARRIDARMDELMEQHRRTQASGRKPPGRKRGPRWQLLPLLTGPSRQTILTMPEVIGPIYDEVNKKYGTDYKPLTDMTSFKVINEAMKLKRSVTGFFDGKSSDASEPSK